MKQWETICQVSDIPLNSGRAALLGKQQVAVFRISNAGIEEFYAIDNHDPFSGANVISRGIIGSLKDQLVVASPVYKQHFCLRTGACLEENVQLRTWKVRTQGDNVQVGQ
ncbi:nitrite reductase small subunit NirD [Halieaceae bacterium IMCC14734]|uniref:Nitrite reductase small subunit NirD n=1 Tax=Candidatus Litorirhabdus singularis TaxID=2518993 RepID=A0ABT3TEK1_9GAMM|nr:nitrite reductase small subunit NirD [Candidatus Litorirhabdus singularis]MCX2980741.1 nitrite reductase small subunit NirD [Candidatus Litorirhabdus singularis]